MAQHTMNDLRQFQAMPLPVKVAMTQTRIRAWVNEYGVDGVYVSFSGGKDSTVLLHLVRQLYPDVPAVFVDTGLEYPEIRDFVKTFDNVIWIKPKMNFRQVVQKYGYPFISKEVSNTAYYARKNLRNGKDSIRLQKMTGTFRQKNGEESQYCYDRFKFLMEAPFNVSSECCNVMKKNPTKAYEKETGRHPFTAQMAEESRLRKMQWIVNGCNGFNLKRPVSNPMSFWQEQDVLLYIKENNLPLAAVYGEIVFDYGDEMLGQMDISELGLAQEVRPLKTTGCSRTGCMFCGYGCHIDKEGEGKFERMKKTHPKIYDYIMRSWEKGGLNYKEVIDWINEHGDLNIRY